MTRHLFSAFILVTVLLFSACGGSEESTDEKNTEAPEKIDTTAAIDTLSAAPETPEPVEPVFSDEQLTMLKKYLDDAMLAKLEEYCNQFQKCGD